MIESLHHPVSPPHCAGFALTGQTRLLSLHPPLRNGLPDPAVPPDWKPPREFSDARVLGGYAYGFPRPPRAIGPGIGFLTGTFAKGCPLDGWRALAADAPGLSPILRNAIPVGWKIEDPEVTIGFFPASTPPCRADAPPEYQAAEWFAALPDLLASGGFTFADTARTWFHLDDILSWYDPFNSLRNRFFEQSGTFEGLVPASTGVGASNASGAALCADILCIRPKPGGCTVEPVPSPLQCPALDYRSSFSRAVECTSRSASWLMVSGTASIEPGGTTAHPDDADAQVALTMDVIEAILESRGLDWNRVWRGVTYLRDPSILPAYQRWLDSRHLANLPLIPAICEICRDDLLFEVELDAVREAD